MEIKYSKKKHELREDPVMEGLIKARHYVTDNGSRLVVALAAVLLVFGGYNAYNYMKKSSLRKAQDSFGAAMIAYEQGDTARAVEALTVVIDNHRNSPHAGYSAYLLGHLFLGADKYDQAITWFEMAAERDNAGFVVGGATEALGMCYEAKGNLDRALEHYRKALGDERVAYRHPALRWKMALALQESGKVGEARQQCEQLVEDTLAGEYRKLARNLLAETLSL